MDKIVADMTAEEIANTHEYKEGMKAYSAKRPQNCSLYPSGNQNLLFRIGWGDSDLMKRGRIYTPMANTGASFLDGRTRAQT